MRDESELVPALQWRWGAYFMRNDHEWSYGHGDTCIEICFLWFPLILSEQRFKWSERYTYDFLMRSRALYC
jgi:hypothetical protein